MTLSTSELESRIDPEGASNESHHDGIRATTSCLSPDRPASGDVITPDDIAQVKKAKRPSRVRYSEPIHDDTDEEIDVRKEKRTQKYMITMVTLFAICWCPVNILILVTHFVYETDNNVGHFDITYPTFLFFGFLSTCVNPVLIASWQMSNQTKDRLRGYFRFSNRSRRRSSAHSSTSRTTEIYAPAPTPSPKLPRENNGLTVPKHYV